METTADDGMENAFSDLRILRNAAVGYEWENQFLKAALIWQFYRELSNRANHEYPPVPVFE